MPKLPLCWASLECNFHQLKNKESMFLGPFCLAVHKGKEGWGGCESIISQLLHTKKYCTAFRNLLVQMPPVTGDQCYTILTQDTAVCYKIVVLDSVQEGWNWARALGLIFQTHVGANCGARIFSVSGSSETALSNTVHLKDKAHLMWSCLEGGWLGRTGGVCVCLSLGLCSRACCPTERSRDTLHRLHSTCVDLAF